MYWNSSVLHENIKHRTLNDIEVFAKIIGYIFVISNIITGAISLVLTRYVSDAIYFKQFSKIMPSLIGGFILGVIPGTVFFWWFLYSENFDMIFIFLAGVFFALVSTIWILIIYLGALSNHAKVLKIFIVGGMSTIILFRISNVCRAGVSCILLFCLS